MNALPSPQDTLADIESGIAAAKREAPDDLRRLEALLLRLKAVPPSTNPMKFVELLIEVTGGFYSHGQKVYKGLEPINLAVLLAEQNGFKPLLRRALSVRGLVQSSASNPLGALSSLSRALTLAEELRDVSGITAAYVNIGVTLLDMTLYTDGRVLFERALGAAVVHEDLDWVCRMAARAHFGIAESSRHLQEVSVGIEHCRLGLEATGRIRERAKEDDQVEALLEGSYAQLLLAMNQGSEAEAHAARALQLASASGTHRASLVARAASGLVAIHLGRQAEGLAMIVAAKKAAMDLRAERVDALGWAVQGYERVGQPDAALASYRELIAEIKQARLAQLGDPGAFLSGAVPRASSTKPSARDMEGLAHRVDRLLRRRQTQAAGPEPRELPKGFH